MRSMLRAIPYSKAQEFLDYARSCHDANPTVSFTAIIPDWKSTINISGWKIIETIPQNTKFFQNPNGSEPTRTKWPVNILRLERNMELDNHARPFRVFRSGTCGCGNRDAC